MAKAEFNIQEFAKKPFKYTETYCPFQSSGSVPVPCEHDCALFVVRTDFRGAVAWCGCALHWLGLRTG